MIILVNVTAILADLAVIVLTIYRNFHSYKFSLSTGVRMPTSALLLENGQYLCPFMTFLLNVPPKLGSVQFMCANLTLLPLVFSS